LLRTLDDLGLDELLETSLTDRIHDAGDERRDQVVELAAELAHDAVASQLVSLRVRPTSSRCIVRLCSWSSM
jgi:hypothetical protein